MAEDNNQKQENNELNLVSKESLPAVPDFRVGDLVKVTYKIMEGDELVRKQPFEGVVISKKGSDISKTFTVRRIGAGGIGVERIFPLYSPNIEDIEVLKKGKAGRSKLYYLREKKGRAATKVKERFDKEEAEDK